MAEKNWQPISKAVKGAGDLLLRAGAGFSDPAFVGRQADDGRWFSGDVEVKPIYFAQIPPFDAADGESAA